MSSAGSSPRAAAPVAAHYADRTDADSQTAPDEVRNGLVRFLSERSPLPPLLDVGSGVGGNLTVLGAHGPTIGCEISLSAARLASSLGRVVVADGAHLPIADGSVGTAVCTEVLEHVDDPGLVFAEIARVLRPGGLAYVTTPNYANAAGLHKWVADRRSGRHDWNPWGAHEGGYEAFMTGRKLWRAAEPHLELVQVRGLDYGQALTGRFALVDRVAVSRPGQRVLRRVLPRLYASTGRLVWHGMHVELVLRKPQTSAAAAA
jgi:SAM-dependent methyltransferase